MARRPPVISHSGWVTVKLGIDLGEFTSKAPEQDEDRDIVQELSTLFPPHAQAEEANFPLPDVYPLEWGV